jgi:hypothetical protein
LNINIPLCQRGSISGNERASSNPASCTPEEAMQPVERALVRLLSFRALGTRFAIEAMQTAANVWCSVATPISSWDN